MMGTNVWKLSEALRGCGSALAGDLRSQPTWPEGAYEGATVEGKQQLLTMPLSVPFRYRIGSEVGALGALWTQPLVLSHQIINGRHEAWTAVTPLLWFIKQNSRECGMMIGQIIHEAASAA